MAAPTLLTSNNAPDVFDDLILVDDALMDFSSIPVEEDFAFNLFNESPVAAFDKSADEVFAALTELVPTKDDEEAIAAAMASDSDEDEEGDKAEMVDSANTPRRSQQVDSFLEKAHHMISKSPKPIVAWNAEGTSFLVYDPKKLATEILPEYFKHCSFRSFAHELRVYGFKKTKVASTQGCTDCFEFHHPSFVRDNAELLSTIRTRKRSLLSLRAIAPASDDEYACADSKMEEEEEVDQEAVDDLKFQVSELHGEVQQTRKLFDSLLGTLLQSNQQQAPFMQQQQYNGFGMGANAFASFHFAMEQCASAYADVVAISSADDHLVELFMKP